jgi:hypothetical protein
MEPATLIGRTIVRAAAEKVEQDVELLVVLRDGGRALGGLRMIPRRRDSCRTIKKNSGGTRYIPAACSRSGLERLSGRGTDAVGRSFGLGDAICATRVNWIRCRVNSVRFQAISFRALGQIGRQEARGCDTREASECDTPEARRATGRSVA